MKHYLLILLLTFITSCKEEAKAPDPVQPEQPKPEPVKILTKEDLAAAYKKSLAIGSFLTSTDFTLARIIKAKESDVKKAEAELRKWKRKDTYKLISDEKFLEFLTFCEENELRETTKQISESIKSIDTIENVNDEIKTKLKDQNDILQELIIVLHRKRESFVEVKPEVPEAAPEGSK